MTKKIAFLLFDQFQILDVTGPAQVISSANEMLPKPAYDIKYISPQGGLCRSTCGIHMETQSLCDLNGFDSLIISGGKGSRNACEDPEIIRYVTQQSPKVKRLISICTGAFILSKAGLIDGKRVTTHWAYADRLQRQNPRLAVEPDALFIREGRIITSAGVTAGMDLALSVIEEDQGKEIAREIARMMVIFYRRPGGQSQFSAFQVAQASQNDQFTQLCLEISKNPNRDYRISQLAEQVNMCLRTFMRRFSREIGMPPAKFVEKARLDAARQALEETDLNLDQIAYQSGFHSPEVLRRTFHRHMAISPNEYRARFGG